MRDNTFKNRSHDPPILKLATRHTITMKREEICAKKVVLSTVLSNLWPSIADLTSSERYRNLNLAVTRFPLLKVFFKFDVDPIKKTAWWADYGLAGGKLVTDMDVRQIHYYDEVHLLVYVQGSYATRLNMMLSENDGAEKMNTLYYLYEQIREVHMHNWTGTSLENNTRKDIPEPQWRETKIKYWYAMSPKWNVGWHRPTVMKLVENGGNKDKGGDGSNLFICSDQYSMWPAWMQGSMNRMDSCRQYMFPGAANVAVRAHNEGACYKGKPYGACKQVSAKLRAVKADLEIINDATTEATRTDPCPQTPYDADSLQNA